MTNNKIYDTWLKIRTVDYKKYYLSHEERWYDNLEKIKNYINVNKKLPSQNDKDPEIKSLGRWICANNSKSKNKKNLVKNSEIYYIWNKIKTNDYKEYFLSIEEQWYNDLEKFKNYSDDKKKLPSQYDKDPELKFLGQWIGRNNNNSKNKNRIMKKDEIYNVWNKIRTIEYKKYFLSNEKQWYNNLEKFKNYINEKKKLPSQYDKDPEIKSLGRWVCTNNSNYKNKKKIMKNNKVYDIWKNFIMNDYKEYFI